MLTSPTRLGIRAALEKPFSPIGEQALAAARAMVHEAGRCHPVRRALWRPGNVVNLDLADLAIASGRKVFLMDGVASRDYTPNHDAARRSALILSRGASAWRTIADLFDALPSARYGIARRPACWRQPGGSPDLVMPRRYRLRTIKASVDRQAPAPWQAPHPSPGDDPDRLVSPGHHRTEGPPLTAAPRGRYDGCSMEKGSPRH